MLDKIKMNNKKFKLTREDNGEDIGFAISCMYSQAITLDEFKSWIDYVILNSKVEDLPSYIWEIVDWDGRYNIYEYIGFTLMNPLMILVKIIKLRWIHILSYDQMVSRKINNQTTRCANSIFYTTLFTNSAPNYT